MYADTMSVMGPELALIADRVRPTAADPEMLVHAQDDFSGAPSDPLHAAPDVPAPRPRPKGRRFLGRFRRTVMGDASAPGRTSPG